MSNSNPPVALSAVPRWLRWLLLPAVLGWIIFQGTHTTTIAAGSDSSGYMNGAKMFAQGRLQTPQRIPAELGTAYLHVNFVPLGFWMAARSPGLLVPTYPPGLPLHLAAASLVLGWEWGPLFTLVLGATGGLVLLYLCARELGVSAELAFAGSVVLGFCPVFQFSAFQPLSDTLATTWCTAAVWTALRARRGGLGWAWATGAAFAVAVLVRPSNALLLPCLIVLLGNWRRLLVAGIGGLPGALWLGYINQLLNGHPLRTGYGDISTALGVEWLVPTLGFYARWIPLLLPALVSVLPLAALWRWRSQGRVLLALALWGFAFFGFYGIYSITHEVWWCLRFVLPAFPALILASLLGAETVLALPALRARWWRPALAVVLAGWALVSCFYWRPRFDLVYLSGYQTAYREGCRWVREHLPADAIIATLPASGSLYYYNENAVLRWDTMTAEQFREYAALLQRGHRPIYAMLFPGEEDNAFKERMPYQWEKVGDVSGITFWKLVTVF
jgi:hypothetical protein